MPIERKKRLSVDFTVRSTRNVRSRTESVPLIPVTVSISEASVTPECFTTSVEPAVVDADHNHLPTMKRRRDVQEENWFRVREEMTSVGLSLEYPHSFQCSLCGIETSLPIRCLDCGAFFTCCEECESSVHQQKLHKPELWKVRNGFSCCCLNCFRFVF